VVVPVLVRELRRTGNGGEKAGEVLLAGSAGGEMGGDTWQSLGSGLRVLLAQVGVHVEYVHRLGAADVPWVGLEEESQAFVRVHDVLPSLSSLASR
jgi:hypothetical protein